MLRKLVFLASCGLVAVSMSGCCLFCCDWGYDSYGGMCHNGSYGACVVPTSYGACGPGPSGPITRARAMRQERLHRGRPYAGPRGRHAGCGQCGCQEACCESNVCCDGGCGTQGFTGGVMDGMVHNAGLSHGGTGGWMPSSGSSCNCGQSHGHDISAQLMQDGWVQGPWVESTPPAMHPQITPSQMPSGEPKAMPPQSQPVPDPMPVTHEYYAPPRTLHAPVQTGSEHNAAGPSIQPVLWVPGGL